LGSAQLSPEQQVLLGASTAEGSVLNLFATTVRRPQIHEPFVGFLRHLSNDSGLPSRARELAILRTSWLWNSEYEFAHHRLRAREAGLDEQDLTRLMGEANASRWNEADRAVLQAVDELHREAFLSDATWSELGKFLDIKQRIDLIYTVGGYAMAALAINSFGVPLEPGLQGFAAR
jgi:alkylhydroperoxidase family enzyme